MDMTKKCKAIDETFNAAHEQPGRHKPPGFVFLPGYPFSEPTITPLTKKRCTNG